LKDFAGADVYGGSVFSIINMEVGWWVLFGGKIHSDDDAVEH